MCRGGGGGGGATEFGHKIAKVQFNSGLIQFNYFFSCASLDCTEQLQLYDCTNNQLLFHLSYNYNKLTYNITIHVG